MTNYSSMKEMIKIFHPREYHEEAFEPNVQFWGSGYRVLRVPVDIEFRSVGGPGEIMFQLTGDDANPVTITLPNGEKFVLLSAPLRIPAIKGLYKFETDGRTQLGVQICRLIMSRFD